MPKNRQVLISSNEAADLLNEDSRTVQRKAKAGEYPAQKLPGLRGAYVFTVADIQRIKESRSSSTPTASPSVAPPAPGGEALSVGDAA